MRKTPGVRWGLAVGLATTFLIGAVLGGAVAASQALSFGAIRIDQDVSGIVTIVNGPGDAICIAEDSTGNQLCGDVLLRRGSPALTVGDHVNATRIWISGRDSLVITTPSPAPT